MTTSLTTRDISHFVSKALFDIVKAVPTKTALEVELRLGRRHATCFRPGFSKNDFTRILHKLQACDEWTHVNDSQCIDCFYSDGTRRRMKQSNVCEVTKKRTHLKYDVTMPPAFAFDMRLSVCEEPLLQHVPLTPVTYERHKRTHSFTERFWRFDFSVISQRSQSGVNLIKDIDDETMNTYEIELELLDVNLLTNQDICHQAIRRAFALCESLTAVLNHDGYGNGRGECAR